MSLLSRLLGSVPPSVEPATEERSLSAAAWMNEEPDWPSSTATGYQITPVRSMQLSTVWACVRLLTNAIATLPAEVIVSIGDRRFREYAKPLWMIAPDPADATMTWTEHVGQVATSLLLDGNAFVYAPNGTDSPTPLIVLDPSRVEVKAGPDRGPVYVVRGEDGKVAARVGADKMLHASWIKMPGTLRGLSPIEAARQGIGLGLGAEEFGARFFGQGASISFGVEVPGNLTDQQREELRSNLKKRHTGRTNAHSVSVLTGGAKFVPGLGVTNEQAQFLELRKFQVEDIARWFGVPPHMVGSQEPGASSYNSVEQRSLEFREYAVLPLVRRIEDPYQRLVEVPDRLRDTNATASFRFNLDGLARADLKARYEAYSIGIRSGFLTANEARALEDLPPEDGGDKLSTGKPAVRSTAPLPAQAPIVNVHVPEQPVNVTVSPEFTMPELRSAGELPNEDRVLDVRIVDAPRRTKRVVRDAQGKVVEVVDED